MSLAHIYVATQTTGYRLERLGFRLVSSRRCASRPTARAIVGDDWLPPEEVILSLSVRSGLDLLLTALELPAGSEMIVSAVTIPDMVRIVEHHRLVPVPVDVDGRTLQPVLEHLERSITPRTRAILVAHLFGTHIDMVPIIELAKQHDLLVIEDCAQAFVGSAYAGHPDSDCALFSFGPIKTATALGGAVVPVRDAAHSLADARSAERLPNPNSFGVSEAIG